MKVEWLLTEKCNFTCDYCGLYDNSKVQESNRTTLTTFLIEIKAQQLVQDFDFFIFGGEPFLHPEIKYIVQELNRLDIKYTFQTNLSPTSAKVIKEILEQELEHIQKLNISVHLGQQSLSTYSKIIEDLYGLKSFRASLMNIEIMYTDITNVLAWYSLNNQFEKVRVILCPVSDFLVDGFKDILRSYNAARISKVFSDIEFEDIKEKGPNGQKKQRSLIWQDFIEKKQSPKGKPCLLKDDFKMYDSKLEVYNCCFHDRIDPECCPYDTCFLS